MRPHLSNAAPSVVLLQPTDTGLTPCCSTAERPRNVVLRWQATTGGKPFCDGTHITRSDRDAMALSLGRARRRGWPSGMRRDSPPPCLKRAGWASVNRPLRAVRAAAGLRAGWAPPSPAAGAVPYFGAGTVPTAAILNPSPPRPPCSRPHRTTAGGLVLRVAGRSSRLNAIAPGTRCVSRLMLSVCRCTWRRRGGRRRAASDLWYFVRGDRAP